MGLPLSVHYSGIWDTRAVELHPDWAALDAQGSPIAPQPGQPPGIVCPRGPYVDELMIPQMLEILDEYDVDGFWVDGDNWAVQDCYCPRCRREFTRLTGITEAPVERAHPDWPAWRAFQRDSFAEYVTRYADAVHAHKPSCAVCSNWMYTMRHPGPVSAPVDYLSGDFVPSFGVERAEMEGRFLDGHRMPWNLMAWTFCAPEGAPRQTKTAVHLCQEVAEVMSCGGGVFLYDVPKRSGWITSWHQDIFAEVARFCRERQPFSQHTQSVPEAALLFSDRHVWKHNTMPFCMGESYYGLEGALHSLVENQIHTDVLDETRMLERMGSYKLVVVAEQDPVAPRLLEALEAYARKGGTVLLTGAHLADMCPDLAGVVAVEPARQDTWHMPVGTETVSLKGPWRPVRPTDAGTYAPVMTGQQRGMDETHFPAVTVRRVGKGRVAAIHGDFMRDYLLGHSPRQRVLIGELLHSFDIDWTCRVEAPPQVEVSLREGKGRLLVHLVNRGVNPTLTPRQHIVEEVPPTGRLGVELRLEKRPKAVSLEPGGRPVEWTYANNRLRVEISSMNVHDIVNVEVSQ